MNAYYNLMGLGCNCSSLGSVTNYDQIKIGGATYSVRDIIGKTVIAKVNTKVYARTRSNPPVIGEVKAGQPIGVVWSYLRPDQGDGRSWLMFEGANGTSYYVPDERVSSEGLKDQGVATVKEEVKKEQEEQMKKDDPVGYYLKKYGLPLVLIIGGIAIAKAAAPALISKAFPERKASN